MAEPFAVIHVANEDEAWKALAAVLAGEMPPDSIPWIEFEGWPFVSIRLPETPVSGSISPTMMEAFIELQKTIYRSHTLLTADTGDLRTLSRSEKADLEFRVRVEEGSSNYNVDLSAILENLGTEALNKMESAHIAITVLGLALIIGGVVVWKSWLHTKAEQRKSEIDDADKQRWLESQQAILEHDTRRMELLANAMARQPLLSDVDAAADPARVQMTKAVADEGGGSVSGVTLDTEFASEIVSQRRQQSEETRLAGVYRVARVDTTSPEGFRVTLTDIRTGQEIAAVMRDVLLSEQHRATVQDAEWNKKPVFVEMTAKRLRNRIVDAVVINAREAQPEEVLNLPQSRT